MTGSRVIVPLSSDEVSQCRLTPKQRGAYASIDSEEAVVSC